MNNILPRIEVEFNTQLFSQSNILMKEKNNEANKLEQNNTKKIYYEQLMIKNENLAREIKDLKKMNHLLSLENQKKEQLFLEKEQNLLNQINKFNPEEYNNTLFQNKNINEIINNKNDINDNNVNKEENINLKRDDIRIQQKGKLLMQYILNMDHKYGKLDEIRQKEIDKENEKLKNDYYQSKNKKDNIIFSSRNSLDDLRKQIIDPKKQMNYIPNLSGTLSQNFEKSGISNQNNINKRNLDNNMSVSQFENQNNKKINKDNNMSISQFENQNNKKINRDNNMSISQFENQNNKKFNRDNNMSISQFENQNNKKINKDNNMSIRSQFMDKNNINNNKDNNMSVNVNISENYNIEISKNKNYDEPPTPDDLQKSNNKEVKDKDLL